MTKTVKVKTNSKVVQFSAQSDIYGKISLMLQSRKVDLKDVFCCNGKVMKTSKPKLIREVEKGVTTTVNVPIPFVSIFNGMVLI